LTNEARRADENAEADAQAPQSSPYKSRRRPEQGERPMSMQDNSARYSPVSQALHWLSAALVVIAWLLGEFREDFARGEPRRIVDFLHLSAGQLIVVILVLRLVWRLLSPPPPAIAGGASPLAELAQKLVLILPYALLLAVPAAGLATLFADGNALPLFGFGEIASPWAKDKALSDQLKDVHGTLANGFLILAGLHAAAALLHHFRLRDATLQRMLPRFVYK